MSFRFLRTSKQFLSVFLMFLLGGVAIFAAQRLNTARLEKSKAAAPDVVVKQEAYNKAQSEGKVRVIVSLFTEKVPPGAPNSTQVITQQNQIKNYQDQLVNALSGLQFRVLNKYKNIPYINLEVDKPTLDKIKTLKGVAVTVVDDQVAAPDLFDVRAFQNIPSLEQELPANLGNGQIVAVIDTGIDSNHPMLTGKVIDEACFGNCPNGSEGPGVAQPCTDWGETCKHGTAIASVIAGNRVNNPDTDGDGVGDVEYLQGIAKEASLISIRATSPPCTGVCIFPTPYSDGDILAALDWVLAHSLDYPGKFIAAVNMSFSKPDPYSSDCSDVALSVYPGYRDIFELLRLARVGVVTTTGDGGLVNQINAPSCIRNAIPVANGTKVDQIHQLSNVGNFQDLLLAQGTNVKVAFPNGTYTSQTGSSLSAPVVSAALAILQSVSPFSEVNTLLGYLKNSAVMVADNRAGASGASYPRIWTYQAAVNFRSTVLGASQTYAQSGTSGNTTTWNHYDTGGQTLGKSDEKVLQASTYQPMILVTAAYRASTNNTAQIVSASYCGQALQRLGTRVKFQDQTTELWYKLNPPLGSQSCSVNVTFDKDPEARVVSSTLFYNIDSVAPVESFNTGGVAYPPGSTSLQMSKAGPKDSIYLCTYSNYPASNPVAAQIDSSWREFWKTNSTFNGLVQSGLFSSIQRSSDNQTMTMRWTTPQAYPWTALCANFRVKPFASSTPAPTPAQSPSPTPTPPTSTPTPAPVSGLSFSVDLKLNNSDGPVQVTAGATATVSWTINDGASCTASGNTFSGTKTGSGSQSVTIPSTSPFGFSLTCKGAWGLTTDSVVGYTGSAGFSANPILQVNGSDGPVTLAAGSSVVVTWKNPPGVTYTSCTASSAWTGTKAVTGGTQTVTALTAGNKIFALACVNAGVTYTTRRYINVEIAGALPPNNTVTSANGILQRFYTGRNFEILYNTQIVTNFPNFDWGSSGAIPGSPGGAGAITDNYSARWTAQIYPYETAEHTFTAVVDDGLRLWVGDRLLIDSFIYGGRRILTGKVNLVAGRAYPLRAEYFESTGDAVITMSVSSAFSGGGPANVYMTPVDQTSYSSWSLNETSGATASDTGTLGVPGSLFGTPGRIVSCKSAGCINFDGVNDYISMIDKNDMLGNQLTLSAWVNVAAHKNYNYIINKLGSYGNYRLYMDSAGKVRFGIRNTANGYEEQISTIAVGLNSWTHIASTFSQTTKTGTIYINGVASGTKTNYTLVRGDSTQALEVGRSGSYYFKGMIDAVRMYPRVLTQAEITGLFNLQSVLGDRVQP